MSQMGRITGFALVAVVAIVLFGLVSGCSSAAAGGGDVRIPIIVDIGGALDEFGTPVSGACYDGDADSYAGCCPAGYVAVGLRDGGVVCAP